MTCGYVFTEKQAAHNLTYAAEGAVITEACENPGCSHSARVTLSAPAGTLIYDGATAFDPSVNHDEGWKAGKPVISLTRDGQVTSDTMGAGNYTASITVGGVTASVSYTVSQAANEWTAAPAISGWIYGGTAKSPAGAAKFGSVVFTYSKAGEENWLDTVPTEAGDYVMKAAVAGTNNYTGLEEKVNFTIAKASAPQIAFPTAGGITYGQKLSESALTGGSIAYGSFAWTNPETIPESSAAAAKVTFTPNAEALKNYSISAMEQDVAIAVAKATPTVTAAVDAIEHSAAGESCAVTMSVSLAKSGAGAFPTGAVTFALEDGTELGTAQIDAATGKATCTWAAAKINTAYSIIASYAGDANYSAAASDALAVDTSKRQQAGLAIVEPGAKTYGDAAFELAFTGGSGDGAVTFASDDPDVLSILGATATILRPGTVTITLEKAADIDYNSARATLTLTIGKRALSITADSHRIYEGDPLPEQMSYSVDGLVGGDTFSDPTITTAADADTAGTYDILISGGTLSRADCYEVTYHSGTLTVLEGVPPVITSPTQDQTAEVYEGGTATLTVTADDAKGYQWYVDRNDGKGFVPIDGATDASYTTSAVKLENNGYSYACVVTGNLGNATATSPTFTLRVLTLPPKTGDRSHMLLWMGLLLLSAAGAMAIRHRRGMRIE